MKPIIIEWRPCRTCGRWNGATCALGRGKKFSKKQKEINCWLWQGAEWPNTTAAFECYMWSNIGKEAVA